MGKVFEQREDFWNNVKDWDLEQLKEAVYCRLREPLRCYDCGRRYDKGPDLMVPDEYWKMISPFGLKNIPATFKSGPFCILE